MCSAAVVIDRGVWKKSYFIQNTWLVYTILQPAGTIVGIFARTDWVLLKQYFLPVTRCGEGVAAVDGGRVNGSIRRKRRKTWAKSTLPPPPRVFSVTFNWQISNGATASARANSSAEMIEMNGATSPPQMVKTLAILINNACTHIHIT